MVLCVRNPRFGHRGVLAIADPPMFVEPTAVELADITIATAASVRALLGVEPVVALLSFSTKGSGKHKKSGLVVEAYRLVQARSLERLASNRALGAMFPPMWLLRTSGPIRESPETDRIYRSIFL